MSLMNYLNDLVKQSFSNNGYTIENKAVKLSDRPDLSQFQCNEAFEIAKATRQNPRVVAEKIAAELRQNPVFKDVSVAGPGFINISLSDTFLANYIQEMSIDPKMGIRADKPKKILIDYGGANVAKPLHVGHLRSAIIGEGLKRLAKELGHDVIGDVHLGDWGRPLGIVISEIKRRNPGLVYFDENYTGEYPSESPVTMDDLNEIYPTASAAAKEDEERMREAREATAILQNEDRPGHRGYYALWQHIINESIKDLKQSYDKLGVNFELWRGESDCIKSIPEMMDIFAKKNLLRQSNGATVMDVDEPTDSSPVPPLILKTQSDSVGYQTTELATIYERVKEFEPDEIWYVVDGRQEMHFKQVFRGAYKSGIVPEDMKLRFIGFGTMNGKDGKPFKTRDGGVMKLSDLLELVQKSSEKRLEESGVQFSEEEKKDSAYKIADATIKYADALSNRETDYIFDIDKFVETQGKTGPYILYSAVRINSLLKKALEQGIEPGKIQEPSKNEERMLMLTISRLPDIVDTAFENKSLTEIANYLYELNSAYNSFYNTTKVIGEQDKDKQKSWIQLSSMVGKINKKLLDTMAIEEPERM
jgi:arginyl-tRNA synthetase